MSAPLPPVPDNQSTDRSGRLTPPWQSWFYQLYTYLTATSAGGGGIVPATRAINTTAPISGGGTLAGDLTISLTANGVTNTYLAKMPTLTIKGNNTGGTATPVDLTVAQVNAMLPVLTSTLNGLAPLSGGGTTNYLRADGTWTSPPGSGTTTNSATFNNGGAGAVSGSTFNGSAPLTVSYNTIGAPSTGGTGASGTWSISISGVAATATALATPRAINGTNFDGTAPITITANTTNAATFNNSNAGAASGTTFDGSVARTISANTVGALALTGGTLTGDLTVNSLNLLVGETSSGYAAANRGVVEVNGSVSALFGMRVGGVNKAHIFHGGTDLTIYNDASGVIALNVNGANAVSVANAGNVTINAPSSGSPLAMVGTAATNVAMAARTGTTTGAMFDTWTNTGGLLWAGIESSAGGALFSGSSAYAAALGTQNATSLQFGTNAVIRQTISSAGNVTINAPSSGVSTLINGLTSVNTLQLNSTGAASNMNFAWNTGLVAGAWNLYTQSTDPFAIGTVGSQSTTLYTANAARLAIGSAGNVTINAPSSGVAATINGLSTGVDTVLFKASANSAQGQVSFAVPAGTVGSLLWDNGTSLTGTANSVALGGVASTVSLQTSSANRVLVNGTGNVKINAPSSGNHLTLADTSTSTPPSLILGGGFFGRGAFVGFYGSSAAQGKNWLVGNQYNISDTFEITPSTANGGNTFTTPALKIVGNGNVTISAPTSGQTLTVAPSPAAGELIATSSALTTGAGASVGTLTNAPSAGNPTKWIKINDNGTIRSIPAW